MISELLSQYGYYGFLSLGALSMIVLTVWRRKIYSLSFFCAICFPLLLLICGIAGAKLLYFVESGFSSFGGMSFFGSIYLVLLLMPAIGLFFNLRPSRTLDACAPCVASIIGFMRFGCLCAGCCGGTMCSIGTLTFRWPTQLLEGFGDIIILGFLLSWERNPTKKGMLYPTFLIAYGVMRFFIEFLRMTPKDMWFFSEGQWLALLGIAIGVAWFFIDRKEKAFNEYGA